MSMAVWIPSVSMVTIVCGGKENALKVQKDGIAWPNGTRHGMQLIGLAFLIAGGISAFLLLGR